MVAVVGGVARAAVAALLTLVASATPTIAADEVADFYRGKVVSIIIASGPGANHTYYSQLLIPYLRKELPGHPDFVIKNMGGAGGMVAANYLFNRSPRDGTEIALLLADTPMASRLQSDFAKYDAKAFQYLGGAEHTRDTLAVLSTAGVRTVDEATRSVVVVGASGRGSKTYVIPALANNILGTRFKIVTGYPGMNEVEMAMERSEVQARLGVWASMKTVRPHWIEKNLVTHLFVADVEPEPELPGVPTLVQLARRDEDRKIVEFLTRNGILGRAWLAPPGVPQARIDALREAFWRALHNPDFVAAAKERGMALSQVRWQKLQAAAATIADADDDTVARARELLKQ